ncbi:GNAT family N-acetyltransferase [Rubrolithibacter danxiaensis]|uniref:GNAT family N-acetyltransferase n=1 Tax=Rubrolithibacter danxiaensis TaxID=3390805 RepID=UPI003BF8F353
MSDIEITEQRFELHQENRTAFIEYKVKNGILYLIHTEVPSELEGRGIASRLAKFALDYAKEMKLELKVFCAFINSYLERHPEYKTLLTIRD